MIRSTELWVRFWRLKIRLREVRSGSDQLHGVLGLYKTLDGRHDETTGTTNRQALLFARSKDYICIEITLQKLVNAS